MSDDDKMIACPVCGTKNRAKAFRCRDCCEILPAGKIDHEQIRLRQFADHPAKIEPDESFASEIGMANALARVALVAVCVGFFLVYPGVGILIGILCLPFFLLGLFSFDFGFGIVGWIASIIAFAGLTLLIIGASILATCTYLTGGLGP